MKAPIRTKRYNPPSVVESSTPTAPKKTPLASIALTTYNDGTYDTELSGNVDLILCISLCNELQNILAKIHGILSQQSELMRREALKHIPFGGPN